MGASSSADHGDRSLSEAVSAANTLTLAVVVLTMGQRNDELRALAQSLEDHTIEQRVLIVNGGASIGIEGWTEIVLDTNIGVPAGRSLGAATATTDVIVYLDDDCALQSLDLLVNVERRFRERPDLGALGFQVQASGGGVPMRRWVPASSAPEADQLRMSTTFPGGGHAIRRAAFNQVGGYCDALFFKHEETDLSWRLLDNGWEVAYDPTCVIEHPPTPEGRHANALRIGARNKVWIARMALPWVLVPASIAVTMARYLGRCRSVHDVRQITAGVAAGFSALPGQRVPMRWQTIWLLSKRGRPPIL